jgi:hypothetical protein
MPRNVLVGCLPGGQTGAARPAIRKAATGMPQAALPASRQRSCRLEPHDNLRSTKRAAQPYNDQLFSFYPFER